MRNINLNKTSNIEKLLYEHLYIEYRWGKILNDDQFLNETYGQIPQIDEYVDDFEKAVSSYIEKMEMGDTISVDINTRSFLDIQDRFFDACNIELIISLNRGSVQYKGGYDTRESFFNKGGVYLKFKITITAFDKDILLSKLKLIFAHELTHAHEDYMRYKGEKESLNQYAEKTKYFNTGLYRNNPRYEVDKILGTLLNRLNRMELNAIIGQIGTELRGKKDKLSSSKKALGAIKETDGWRTFEYMATNMEAINNITDNALQQYIIDSYNKITEEKINTYQGVVKRLNKKYEYWKRKFLVKTSKLAYEMYMRYGGMIQDDNNNETNFQEIIKH